MDGEAAAIHKRTTEESSNELSLLRCAYSVYVDAMLTAQTIGDKPADFVRMGLASQNLNILKIAIDAATRGYYIQSVGLLRNVYENWLAFMYLDKFPSKAYLWLEPSAERRPPKAEKMRNRVDLPYDDAKAKLLEFYQVFSRFSHTDSVAVLSLYRDDHGSAVIVIGAEYDRAAFSKCAYGISILLGIMISELSQFVPSLDPWNDRFHECVRAIMDFIDKYNATYADAA